MKGSVVKRTDKAGKVGYYVVIDERDDTGKRRRRWHSDPTTGSAFTSKRAADAHAATLVTSVASATYVPPARETVDTWLDAWLGLMKPNLKPSTYASYERVLRVHVRPRIGAMLIRKVTAADLDRMYAAMLAGGRADHREGEPLSPRTVRYAATILGRALKDATRKGIIARNPAELADPPKASQLAPGAVRAWSAPDLRKFLEGSAEHPYAPVWAFLAGTACRRGEALGLRWQDVDLDGKRASLVQSVQKVGGKVVFGTVKTDASRRSVALDSGLVDLLREQRKAQAKTRLLIGPGWVDRDLVFAGPTGEPLYPEGVTRSFAAEAKRLGLPSIPLHGLRHTWATVALAAGIHPKVVQERLGHANVGITLNIYSHVAPVMHDDAAQAVADLVRAAGAKR